MTVDEVKTRGLSPQPAVARCDDRPDDGPTVVVAGADQLGQYLDPWEDLCQRVVARNVFYEPWLILHALEYSPDKEALRFVLIFGPQNRKGIRPLWGFFPLEIRRHLMNLPVRSLAFWQHRWCYLTTPLIAQAHVWPTLETFWRWFSKGQFGCCILDTNHLLADGPFHAVWADFALGRSTFMLGDFPRAFLEPSVPAADYISSVMSNRHFGEFMRLERRLSEMGKLEYRQIENLSEVSSWIDEFLRLEASGWKGGPDGRAFGKRSDDAGCFRALTLDGFARNRAMLISLELDGKPIAMKHNLLSGDGSFAFRIAHDESYAKYSPGVLLELENIRRVCLDPRTRWMDSCAVPRHVMANRIWSERRMIRRTLFSNGSAFGDLLVAIFPLLRWVKKRFRPSAQAPYLEVSTNRKISGD